MSSAFIRVDHPVSLDAGVFVKSVLFREVFGGGALERISMIQSAPATLISFSGSQMMLMSAALRCRSAPLFAGKDGKRKAGRQRVQQKPGKGFPLKVLMDDTEQTSDKC